MLVCICISACTDICQLCSTCTQYVYSKRRYIHMYNVHACVYKCKFLISKLYLGIAEVIDSSRYECLCKLGGARAHRGGQGANDTKSGHDVVLVGIRETSLQSSRKLTKAGFNEFGSLNDLLDLYVQSVCE